MKKYRGRIIVLSLVVAAAFSCVSSPRRASAHKFHTSFTEADYNAETKSLEVTLRTFPDDLANVIRKREGQTVSLDDKKAFGERALAYLQDSFRLKNAKGEAVKLSWVGMDAGVDSAWLYFEAPLPEGIEGTRLSQQFLCDLYDDQLNLVNVKSGARKTELRFERGGDFQMINFK
ncbi:MAG: hypothetical protein QOE33_1351 [Acidobacteriota bacterium]|nr:hypothetical protein [Acidobacteriota bacterium]